MVHVLVVGWAQALSKTPSNKSSTSAQWYSSHWNQCKKKVMHHAKIVDRLNGKKQGTCTINVTMNYSKLYFAKWKLKDDLLYLSICPWFDLLQGVQEVYLTACLEFLYQSLTVCWLLKDVLNTLHLHMTKSVQMTPMLLKIKAHTLPLKSVLCTRKFSYNWDYYCCYWSSVFMRPLVTFFRSPHPFGIQLCMWFFN
jgi:hypothetical protein